MVLSVHRNHRAYGGGGGGGEVGGGEVGGREGMEVVEEGDYVPIATLSPPE